jgi:hypothetical protein
LESDHEWYCRTISPVGRELGWIGDLGLGADRAGNQTCTSRRFIAHRLEPSPPDFLPPRLGGTGGLAFMEGNMRGPSSQDCEKSFVKTGVPSANMLAKKRTAANLVQIRALPSMAAATA